MRIISLSHRITATLLASALALIGCGLLAGQAQAAVRMADWNRIQHSQIGDTYSSFNVIADWRGSRTGLGSAVVTSGNAFAWNRLGGCVQVYVYGYFNGAGWRQVRGRVGPATYVHCVRSGYNAQMHMAGAGVSGYGLRGMQLVVCYSRYASTGAIACSRSTTWR